VFGKKKKTLIADGVGDLNSKVELTLLNPKAQEKDVYNICNIAYKNRYFGVVVFPIFVKTARDFIDKKLEGSLKVIAAVDFPFGASGLNSKVSLAKRCFSDGADEVDFTLSPSMILAEEYNLIRQELIRVVRSSHGKIVKAVIEASFLDREQIARLCRVILKTKVDFVMTNTGYGDGGVTPEIVELISANLKGKCGVKASGGITNKVVANDMVRMGATRIGTSRVV